MKQIWKWLCGRATQTLKIYILIPLILIVVSITALESYYITEKVTEIVRQRVLETQRKSNEQVLCAIDRYFQDIADIARMPGNSMEILPILRKYPEDVTAVQILADQYTAQMFMFREIMIRNDDFESVLIYHERQDKFYALSTAYLIQRDRQYDFSIARQDYQEHFQKAQGKGTTNYISGVRPSAMLIAPASDYVITYIQEILIPASIQRMPLGAFFINIDVGTFKKIYERYSADLQSDYYIIDRDGRIVACSDNGRCAQPIAQYIYSLKLNTQEEQSCMYGDVVYTASRVSEICGWRVVKAAKKSTVFAYERDILKFILLGTIILLLLESGVIYFLVSRFTQPITSIKIRLKQITEGDMSIRFDEGDQHPVAEIRDMNMMLQEMLDKINCLIRQIYAEEDEKRKLEMSVLQSQITPHFIYNTISRIQWMATMQQANQVASLLGSFSGILSYCSRNTDYYVSLADEIRFIKEYIRIMQLRLLGEVEVQYDVPSELMDARVLRLILQPIVENVFLHAFEDDGTKRFQLMIRCIGSGNSLLLRVSDNGKGIRQEVLQTLLEEREPHTKDSIALNNIQKRIHSHYGAGFGLTVESAEEMGTVVTVSLPLQHIIPHGGQEK